MLDERDKYVFFMIRTEGLTNKQVLSRITSRCFSQTTFGVKNRAIQMGTVFFFFICIQKQAKPHGRLKVAFKVCNCTNKVYNKNAPYLTVNVFSTKVLIGDTVFYVSYRRQDRHFTWSSEPHEGLPVCKAKGVPSFLSYFKILSIGPAPGIEPATSCSAFKCFTD